MEKSPTEESENIVQNSELNLPSEFHRDDEPQDRTRVTNNRMEAMKVEPTPVATITGDMAQVDSQPEVQNDDEEHMSAADKAHIGTIIAGRYRIINLLGVGGMGSVFKAEHIMLGSFVAVKILNSDLTKNETALKRFSQEAKAANTLHHPNIAAVSDYGLTESGAPYFVMDLIDGKSMASMIDDNGFIPWQKAIDFGIQISDAMSYAHLKGIVHRDLKPANIIISKTAKGEDRATVVDFGIAKFANETQDAQKLTRTGEVFGSPLYMSPEQCTGKTMDSRSDIYSFGCMMYEALTGEMPFCGENAVQTILMQINEPAPSFKSQPNQKTTLVPSGAETVIMHCLEKDPQKRYASMDDVKADLQLVKRGLPPTRKSVKRIHFKFKSPNLIQTGLITAVGTVAMFYGMAFWVNKWQYDVVPWQRDFSAAKHEIERGEYNQAIMSARHGIKLGTTKNAPKHELAGLYNTLGDAYRLQATQEQQALGAAKEAYEKSVSLCTDDHASRNKVMAFQSIGDVDAQAGNKQEALKDYDNALASFSERYVDDTEKARLYIRKGLVYESLNQLDAAEKEMQQAVSTYKSLDEINTPALTDALEKLAHVIQTRGVEEKANQFKAEAKKLRSSFE
ncbi:MAG TPA: serine/threonine-protein kinase [Drouetiella sp.]